MWFRNGLTRPDPHGLLRPAFECGRPWRPGMPEEGRMSDFEKRIKRAADDFAQSVLETLRGLTLTELA